MIFINRYLIDSTDENGLYIRGSDYFIHLTIRDSITPFATSTPSSVKITIYDPCNTKLVDAVAMTNISTGVYSYDYNIPVAAEYGKYLVDVSTTTYTMKKQFDFYVMEWDMLNDVRRLSGIEESKTISDEDLSALIWNSYMEVNDEIYDFHFDEHPICDPDICVLFDGTNKTVKTRIGNLADGNGDGSITGFGEKSCGTDVNGYWYDSDYTKHQCYITVSDSVSGRLLITQIDGTAIPNTNNGVFISYYTQYDTYQNILHREAIAYLAAHKTVKRFGELDRSTLVDLSSNKFIFLADPNKLLVLYENARDKIRKPMFSGCK